MQEIGYDYIVTGHYARVEYDEKRDRYLLKKQWTIQRISHTFSIC